MTRYASCVESTGDQQAQQRKLGQSYAPARGDASARWVPMGFQR